MAAPAFQSHSPLDSLVHRTSAQRSNALLHPNHSAQRAHLPPSLAPLPESSPRYVPQHPSPVSPLLHGHFARDSTATASSSDNNSPRSSIDSRTVGPELDRCYRDESHYSNTGSALCGSWQSDANPSAARGRGEYIATLDDVTPTHPSQRPPSSPFSSNAPVPTLIVSLPNDPVGTKEYTRAAGRIPIGSPAINFSRPVPPTISSTPEDEQQKRRVLERNARRAPNATRHTPVSHDRHQIQEIQSGGVPSLPPNSSPREPTIGSQISNMRSSSPTQEQTVLSYSLPSSQAPREDLSPVAHQQSATPPLSLPRRPPSLRTDSPISVYSGYSIYQLDTVSLEFQDRLQACSPFGEVVQPSAAQSPPAPDLNPTPGRDTTARAYLQQGIQHHEANRLKESAMCFERSAKENGGCGIGMVMWGLALRHGWGCEKNEKFAFKWLTRAAESAVENLENARAGGGIDSNAVQTELVLAIYEVGQSFFQGWGVAKDQKMAVSYYTIAARLGDPDAQSDLAFCLANGKGCKRDRKEAAKWYRAAVAQGQSDIGLAWIYKEKYQ